MQKYTWITNEFFEKILKRELKDPTVFVKTFDTHELNGREQNYWCDVILVEINYVNSLNVSKSEKFLLKVGYYDAYMTEELERFSTFKREMAFYCDIVPNINELMLSNDDDTKFTARALSILDMRPKPKYIMLEDIRSEGYRPLDRGTGLNMDQMKLVLTKLAKFHALTAILNTTREHNLMKHHYEANIGENFRTFHSLYLNCLIACANEVESWPDHHHYAEKLYALEKTMFEKCSDAFSQDQSDFGVLNHSDLSINNILFKFDDDNEAVDALIVNFELGFFGSPGIDLSFLFFISASSSIKDLEFDMLLQHYHKHLHGNLIKFGYRHPIPSLTDIHNEYLNKGFAAVINSMLLLPLRFADRGKLTGMDFLIDDSKESLKMRQSVFQTEEFRERMEFLLNFYDRKGLLD